MAIMGIEWGKPLFEDARRLKRLRVEPAALCAIFKAKGLTCIEVTYDALPDDAVVVGWQMPGDAAVIDLLVASASFPVLKDGHVAPYLDSPQFTRYEGEQAIVKRLREIETVEAGERLTEVGQLRIRR